jgi:hypothetical protein
LRSRANLRVANRTLKNAVIAPPEVRKLGLAR